MRPQTQLVGYADTVGKGVGFLVPVFNQQGSNALLAQRVSDDNTISGFEEIHNTDYPIIYINSMSVAEGEEAVWAFAFSSSDVISGRGIKFRELLRTRLDDPALVERPLLSVEVAEFLDMPERRLNFAKVAYTRLSRLSTVAANTWMDLSVLTPDLRHALTRAGRRQATVAKRLVAAVHDDQVIIRGIPLELSSSIAHEVERIAQDVMLQLSELYPKPQQGWRIQISHSASRRHTSAPDAIVLLRDYEDAQLQPHIQDDFSWRIDAYLDDQREHFRAILESSGIPAFVFIKGEGVHILQDMAHYFKDGVTAIQFGSRVHTKIFDDVLSHGTPIDRIYIPATGRPGTRVSDRATGRIVRQVIAASLAARDQSGSQALEGSWLYYRSSGSGSDQMSDAWAMLYDRAWANGISVKHGYSVGSERLSRQPDYDSGWAYEVLFPTTKHLLDHRVEAAMRQTRTNAAILLSETTRDEEEWRTHSQLIERVLSYRGWDIKGTSYGDVDWTIELEGQSNLRYVQTRPDITPNKGQWWLPDLLNRNIESIETITVTANASASNIIARLYHRNELAVGIRDLCGSTSEVGIWSILAQQVRRFSTGQMNRSCSHFMALLIEHAFQHGRVDCEEAGSLREAIYGPTFGKELHLSWSRVRQSSKETCASVRLLAGFSNQYSNIGDDVIPPFSIELRKDGIYVLGDQEHQLTSTKDQFV
jgi:hypothetical protein